jgi:RimJ/RimL family protein N-acetyltransferase
MVSKLRQRLPWRVQRVLRRLWSRDSVLIYRMASDAKPVGVEASGSDQLEFSICTVREAKGRGDAVPPHLRRMLHDFPDDSLVHFALVNGATACWGISAVPVGSWPITETDTTLTMPPNSACLVGFETDPEFRGRGIYKALLREILRFRFASGVPWAYIWCEEGNTPSRAAIERVGFTLVARHEQHHRLGAARRSVS